MKKTGYKYQILQVLQSQNWEVIEIGQDTEWWDDEHWKIQHKYAQSLCLYLCFLVDPLFEAPRKKGQGINEILVSELFPENWNDYATAVASIYMARGKFNEKLAVFSADLKQYFWKKTKAS